MSGLMLGSGTTTLRSLVRSLCFEQDADEGLFTTQQLDDLINVAHRRLYNKIAVLTPQVFASQSADLTCGASGYAYGGTTLHAQGVHQLVRVELKTTTGNYLPLENFQLPEVGQVTGPLVDVNGQSFFGWYDLGQTIKLYPTPTGNQTIRATFIPGLADLSATTDYPFGGSFRQFHDVVAYLAAVLALEKDECPKWLKSRFQEMEQEFITHCRRSQVQRPRRILETAWED